MAGVKTTVSQSPQWTLKIDQVDSNNIYIGAALIGTATNSAKWQIRKITTSSGVVSILWANASTAANQIWDNRASLSYS